MKHNLVVLPGNWLDEWQGEDVFAKLFSLEGKVYRNQDGRRTICFTRAGRNYFGKFHCGVGWKEILKNLIQLRLPVIGAQNEWKAIKRLEQLGIRTMRLVGYGKKGWNPSQVKSFVITEELSNTVSLEDFCHHWQTTPPDCALKRALIKKIAFIAHTLHENGMNHRDFYICHFLLDISGGQDRIDPNRLTVYLIDLHRMQIRRHLSSRWRIKDIGSLYFSSMKIGLTQRDLFRFMQFYTNKPLRSTLKENRIFWWRVTRRAKALYREFQRKYPHNV